MRPRGSTIVSISGRRDVGDARWLLPTHHRGSIEVAPHVFDAITPGKQLNTGQPFCAGASSVSDLEFKRTGRHLSVYPAPICARAPNSKIPGKLNLRGHHDWPDKRRSRQLEHMGSSHRVCKRRRGQVVVPAGEPSFHAHRRPGHLLLLPSSRPERHEV